MKKRYWDSDAFIGWLAKEDDKVSECRVVIRAAEEGKTVLITSALTLAEVLWLRGKPPIPAEDAETVQRFFEHEYIAVVDVDRACARSTPEEQPGTAEAEAAAGASPGSGA